MLILLFTPEVPTWFKAPSSIGPLSIGNPLYLAISTTEPLQISGASALTHAKRGAEFAMQSSDHGSPSSSLPASIPNDIVLRPNATSDEKLQLLALLVPKAENARNRVADLHAKTSANLDKCLKFAAQIKEVHVYAQLFFTQMNPQLVVRAYGGDIDVPITMTSPFQP